MSTLKDTTVSPSIHPLTLTDEEILAITGPIEAPPGTMPWLSDELSDDPRLLAHMIGSARRGLLARGLLCAAWNHDGEGEAEPISYGGPAEQAAHHGAPLVMVERLEHIFRYRIAARHQLLVRPRSLRGETSELATIATVFYSDGHSGGVREVVSPLGLHDFSMDSLTFLMDAATEALTSARPPISTHGRSGNARPQPASRGGCLELPDAELARGVENHEQILAMTGEVVRSLQIDLAGPGAPEEKHCRTYVFICGKDGDVLLRQDANRPGITLAVSVSEEDIAALVRDFLVSDDGGEPPE